MTQDTDLLPCPFCGNAPKVQEPQTVECWSGIYCNCLDMPKPAMWKAVEKWNTRTPSSTRANERDFLSSQLILAQSHVDRMTPYERSHVQNVIRPAPQPSPQSDMVAVPREVVPCTSSMTCLKTGSPVPCGNCDKE